MSTAERSGSSAVIVGASAAGVSAALELRRRGHAGPITLLDQDPRTPYERPPLSKSIVGEDAGLRPIVPPSTYDDHGIELLLGRSVARIDPERREVVLGDGEVRRADDIVLATGVAARPLDVPGADLPGVLLLRDAADAAELRARLHRARHLVVVGASFIGLELAAAVHDHEVDVTVVELGPGPLAHVFDAPVSSLVRHLHEDRGVRFRFEASVREVLGTEAVEGVVLTNGTVLPADLVVTGIGVAPRTALAREAGIAVDAAGIVVDEYGRTSAAHVYACGDVASQPHPALSFRGRIEHWDTALKHGAAVGATVAGHPTAFADQLYAWSDQYGLTFQYFGRRHAEDTLVLRKGATPDRFIAYWFRDGRMSAVLGCDARKEIGIARRLIAEALPLDAEAFAAADADLRALHREATSRASEPAGLR
jgi:3-phenylpropionate/trans-cinnamate dioxygenase ferredoxin reductase subunit